MTCIVGTPEFMIADRCFSDSTGAVDYRTKIAKNKWLIAAACGDGQACMNVLRAVRKGAQAPEDLIELLGKEDGALALTPDGRLWLCEKGVFYPTKGGANIQGIGSGADLALGYLHGGWAQSPYWPPDARMARRALKFAASRRKDCGGGADVRRF